jgi:hypothetical protein
MDSAAPRGGPQALFAAVLLFDQQCSECFRRSVDDPDFFSGDWQARSPGEKRCDY